MRQAPAPRSGSRRRTSSAAAISSGLVALFLILAAFGAVEIKPSTGWVGILSASSGVLGATLLTATIVLGVVSAVPGVLGPSRLVARRAHRIVSVLAAIAVAVHVWTAISVPYFGFGLRDAFVPVPDDMRGMTFATYGALAVDLLVIVVGTSAIQEVVSTCERCRPCRQVIWRAWRQAHWLVFPVAVSALVHVAMVPTRSATAHAVLVTFVLVSAMLMTSAVLLRIICRPQADTNSRGARGFGAAVRGLS